MSFCTQCGTQMPDAARFCPDCGAEHPAADNPATVGPGRAEQADPLHSPAVSADHDYAGIGRRVLAHLVDAIVVLIIYLVIGYQVAARTGGLTDGGFDMEGGPALVAIGLTFLASMIYFAVMESSRSGKTFGKRLAGIRVANADGGKAKFGQALTRNILRLIDGLVFYIVGIILIWRSDRNQRLGDRVAHTIVLRTHAAPESAGAAKEEKKSGIRFSMGTRSGVDYLD